MSWLVVAASFLVGSIPFSYLVVRLGTGTDLRRVGSHNPGATNALRAGGPMLGVVGLVFDIAKGFVPVWLALDAGLPGAVIWAVAVAAVVGHMASPFLGFRGGKGVATGLGALSALNPIACLASMTVFVITVVATRIVSVGSILAVALLPFLWLVSAWVGFSPAAGKSGWWAAVAICGLVLLRHRSNVRRLLSGTESRLGGEAA